MDLLRSGIRNKLLLFVFGLILAFQLATIRPGLLFNEDACLYLSHARNLALGQPYSSTHFIYTTETAVYSPAVYPPVFPVMIAPLYHPMYVRHQANVRAVARFLADAATYVSTDATRVRSAADAYAVADHRAAVRHIGVQGCIARVAGPRRKSPWTPERPGRKA